MAVCGLSPMTINFLSGPAPGSGPRKGTQRNSESSPAPRRAAPRSKAADDTAITTPWSHAAHDEASQSRPKLLGNRQSRARVGQSFAHAAADANRARWRRRRCARAKPACNPRTSRFGARTAPGWPSGKPLGARTRTRTCPAWAQERAAAEVCAAAALACAAAVVHAASRQCRRRAVQCS